jgi:hypothetical protein
MSNPIDTIFGGITDRNKAGQEKRAINAANAIQQESINNALDKQEEIYGQNTDLYKPSLQQGQQLQDTYSYLMGLGGVDDERYSDVNRDTGQFGDFNKSFTMADFEADPAYEFIKSEGQKALDRKASASGRFFSGAASKDLADYNQNMALTSYNDARNRFNQDRESLYSKYLTGTDQANEVLANQVNLNQNYGNTYSGLVTDKGDVGANAIMATSAAKGRGSDANAGIVTGVGNAALDFATGGASAIARAGSQGMSGGARNLSYGFGGY